MVGEFYNLVDQHIAFFSGRLVALHGGFDGLVSSTGAGGSACCNWTAWPGCRDEYIDLMAGVPHIADDLLHYNSRQPGARSGNSQSMLCCIDELAEVNAAIAAVANWATERDDIRAMGMF
jgi:hypothetical protein